MTNNQRIKRNRKIAFFYEQGLFTQRELSEVFNLSLSSIARILKETKGATK